MNVRIVCYEEPDRWILGKFARNLCEELRRLGEDADVARVPDPAADINHHIIYIDYEPSHTSIDTLMVTHIDVHWKLRKLREQLRHAAAAVCMSSDTVRSLGSAGLPSGRLCYVNPAHDGLITPRPFNVGIATRLYPDGRKREGVLLKTVKRLDPSLFSFAIMGEGWDEIVARLCEAGFTVAYHPGFDAAVYREMIRSLDYYLYLGMDEGSMGFVDAVAAGVATIVTRQGYHLDAPAGLTHPFESEEELAAVFERIVAARRSTVQAVASWTWRDYAIKHLQIWDYLKNGTVPATFSYPDGIASLLDEGSSPGIAHRCKTEFGYLTKSIRSLLSTAGPKTEGRVTRPCSGRDSLRVVMPIYYFFPVMGGAEQQACRLAGELIRMGHDVSIFTGRWRREWAADEHLAGVPVHRISTLWPWLDRVKGFFFRHLAFEIGLAWYLFRNRHRYDVIHVHQALHAAFVASLAAPLARKPVLVKIGCGGVNSDVRIMRENIVNPLSSWFWKAIRRCDRFIAISHEIEQELLADGIDPSRVTRLPNGISVEGYEPKASYDSSSPLRCISVGRLDPQKGYEVLLDALSRFALPGFELRVYGEGGDREMLQGLIRSRGLEGRVFLEGVVHDLPQRLSGSDLFVLVSRAEGLSNALMEAMLCGLPCIVTAVGGNTDLVAPEDVAVKVDAGGYRIMSNGIVVNSDDPEGTVKALELLAGDRELAARLGRAAAAWMRRHNALDQVAERYVGIYRELLHQEDGRPAS